MGFRQGGTAENAGNVATIIGVLFIDSIRLIS